MVTKNIIYSILVQLFGFTCNVGSIAFLTHYLSKTEFGFFSLLVSIITVLVVLVTSSVSDFAVKEVSKANFQNNKKKVEEVAYYCGIVSLTTIFILSLIVLFIHLISDSLTLDLSVLIILSVFSLSYVTIIGSMLRGLGFPILGQAINVVLFPSFFFIGILASIYLPGQFLNDNGHHALLVRLISSHFSFFLAITFFLFFWSVKVVDVLRCYFRNEWLLSSLEFLKIGFLGAINRQANIFLLAFVATIVTVGEFRLVLLGLSVFEQISAVGLVMLQAKFAQGELSDQESTFKHKIFTTYGLIFLVSLTGFIFFVLFGKYIIVNVFGENFKTVYFPLLIVIFGHLINLFFGPVGIFMTMRGYAKNVTKNLIISLLTNLISSVVLIFKFGVLGAALGLVCGTVVFNIMTIYSCRKHLKFNPSLISAITYVSQNKA